MNLRSRIILILLGLALLLQGSNIFYAFFTRIFPLSAGLNPWLKAGTATLMAGTFYYLVALAAFFMQKPQTDCGHCHKIFHDSYNEPGNESIDSSWNTRSEERANAGESARTLLLIAGRPFKINRSIMNPGNHIVLSTILLLCAFATILATQLQFL